ncbi:hypothetical protein NLU13_7026 [Sarocladium strictum]|uniref:Zn(2)-C6 fungal-type domain-containing protein n=1 Tax=Sarocladium strictum TaxID=5046 RepID=A0AA39L6P9_SARSR|nr:hypothetical protein NLU13_7026 [Sarocladium strictum]
MEGDQAQAGSAASANHRQPPASTTALSCTQCRSRKLRCDRQRPACGRCVAQEQACSYPASRHHAVGRRKTVRELEERIGQLEELLRAATLTSSQDNITSQPAEALLELQPRVPRSLDANLIDWSELGSYDGTSQSSYQDLSFEQLVPPTTVHQTVPPLSQSPESQLIDLGLFETLPSWDLIDELTTLFFLNVSAGAPMLHEATYTMSLRLPPHMSPPMCLQYIVLASGAATSPTHRHLAEAFYQRARIYAEADELKGSGQTFATVGHVQSWLLISAYECHVHAVFTRASTSLCRALRIAQMINFHRLDSVNPDIMLSSLPPPRNMLEAEERRRTWWVVFLADRFLTATTDWPSLVDEDLIHTNLPFTEEAFSAGLEQPDTFTLSDGLRELQKGRDSRISSLSVRIIAANELLHALNHTLYHFPRGENNSHAHQERSWQQHNEISTNLNILDTFMNENLPLSTGSTGLDAILVHACTNMANMQLHRVATGLAERLLSSPHVIIISKERLHRAAEETLEMFHAAGDGLGRAIRTPVLTFAAYMASSVFFEDLQTAVEAHHRRKREEGFLFLAKTLRVFGDRIPLVRAMSSQLDTDMRRAGYDPSILNEAGDPALEAWKMRKSVSKQLPMVFCPALTIAFSSTEDQATATV